MDKFQKKFIIESAEADSKKNYKIYSFLCATQEIANNHATSLNFGYNQLINDNCAWVLSRLKAQYITSPKWQEEVNMSTWHKGVNGIFSIRDFVITNQSGTLIKCTSSWLILNLESRKIQRIDRFLGDLTTSSSVKESAIECPCEKLTPPSDMRFVRKKEVLYSDIDFNLHVNNAKYMEWALDCIDAKIMIEQDTSEFQINFNHEAKIGDIIDLYIGKVSENDFFIEGKNDNNNIFQTIIKLKP